MDIRLYNTYKNQKELFQPIEPGRVKIYNCGVTVYDRCHLGHARGAINFDVLRRVFRAAGFEVTYVKNYTDIDDKMINRANERRITVAELAEENIRSHDADMAALGVEFPDAAPRATQYIREIIAITQRLVDQGFAYEVNGSVFFRVRKFHAYGRLSGKKIDELMSGIRVEVDDEKEDPLDFALWKAAKPNEPEWASPWGSGRPGWHIECSAMSACHLGTTFDIHAGGSDLIFPHHENEIAQSECANGVKYVNYWLHNGMIKIENQKMSKSLGNFATIEDLVKIYHPELIRFFVLSAQYRQSLDFNRAALEKSAEGLDRIYGALEKYEAHGGRPELDLKVPGFDETQIYWQQFMEAMCDDMNSPQAIAVLFDLTRRLNSTGMDDPQAAALYQRLRQLGGILGVLQVAADQWFRNPRIARESAVLGDLEIEQLIEQRNRARAEKDWATADRIRDRLAEASIHIADRDGKTFWQRK